MMQSEQSTEEIPVNQGSAPCAGQTAKENVKPGFQALKEEKFFIQETLEL